MFAWRTRAANMLLLVGIGYFCLFGASVMNVCLFVRRIDRVTNVKVGPSHVMLMQLLHFYTFTTGTIQLSKKKKFNI